MLTKESIITMLKNDKRAVARALVVLYNRQTSDEQAQEGTRHLNGRGFRPCHAHMGSSMAKQFIAYKSLSDRQIEYWRKLDRQGNMRIGIYWGQLLEEANLKAKEKFKMHDIGPRGTTTLTEATAFGKAMAGAAIPAKEHSVEVARDLGNDMERKMLLQEHLNDVMDSDDPATINPIQQEIDEIDTFWNRIRGNK